MSIITNVSSFECETSILVKYVESCAFTTWSIQNATKKHPREFRRVARQCSGACHSSMEGGGFPWAMPDNKRRRRKPNMQCYSRIRQWRGQRSVLLDSSTFVTFPWLAVPILRDSKARNTLQPQHWNIFDSPSLAKISFDRESLIERSKLSAIPGR